MMKTDIEQKEFIKESSFSMVKIIWGIIFLFIGGIPMYIWISCSFGNQEKNLRPVITELAIKLQEELEINDTNTILAIKTDMIEIIHRTLGCKLNYKTYGHYITECRKELTSYEINEDKDKLKISLEKGRSICSIQFPSKNLIKLKDKNIRKDFEYKSSCFTRDCIQVSH